MNNTLKKTIFFILCVAILAIGGFFVYNIENGGGILNNGKQQTTTPEENVFYIAQKGNDSVLFYRYPDLLVEHKKPARTIGHIAHYENGYDLKKHPNEFADFKELQHPKKLFSFEGHVAIENYILSDDKKYLLLSFLGGENDKINFIYQINLQTGESKNIWENELHVGTPPYNKGIAYVTHFIPNRYMILAIIKSTPPPDALPEGVIVMNIQSADEIDLGVVGDVTIDEKKKTVSFKQLEKTPVPCEKNDPVCFATDTYKYVFKPGGDPITKPLP